MHIKPIVLILSLCASAFGQGFKFSDLPFLYNVGREGQYLLYDDFNIPLAAGSVNGTQPTFGPKMGPGGPRTVTDTESKLSISGGQLVFSGGKASPAFGDPTISFAPISRLAGTMLFSYVDDIGATYIVGFAQSPFTTTYTVNAGFKRRTANIAINDGLLTSGVGPNVCDSVPSEYYMCIALRSVGAHYFLKDASLNYWRLLWVGNTDNTSSIYPCIINYSGANIYDTVRVPSAIFIPTPLVSDGFQAANGTALSAHPTDGYGHQEQNGGSGLTWTGNNWGILSNKATNAPATGGDVILDGDFATDPGPWTLGTWVIGGGVATHPAGVADQISTNILIPGNWYYASATFTVSAGTLAFRFGNNSSVISYGTGGTFGQTKRSTGAAAGAIALSTISAGTVDDISFKQLTLSDCISHVTVSSTPDILADACWTRGTTGFQCGIVANYDSATGTNGIFAYYDGNATVNVDVQVNGNWTNKITGAITWSDNAPLRLISVPSSGELRCYYNNALVGSAVTSGFWPGFTNFTAAGLFSTWTNASCTNFVVWARGSEGQYNQLSSY